MGKTISFINMKGGVGKTTLAVNIGFTLATHFKKKVLIIDMDPQMNASQYTLNDEQVLEILDHPEFTTYGILSNEHNFPAIISSKPKEEEKSKGKIFEVNDRFHIIPSHLTIMNIDLHSAPNRLRKFIKDNKLKEIYDVIILDCPPTISAYTKISLLASDSYIVPMKTDYLSFFGLPLLENYIDLIKSEYEHELSFMGIILTMVRPDWKIYNVVEKKINEIPKWSRKLFDSELKQKNAVAEALSPERKSNNSHYILDLGNEELKQQIIDITAEFARKGRL